MVFQDRSVYLNSLKTLALFLFIALTLFSENTPPSFSEEEKKSLNPIFTHLFKFEGFSYTLFSDKPISFESIYISNMNQIPIKDYSVLLSYQRPLNELEVSWNVWKSRQLSFKNYFFFDKKETDHTTIILINKKAFSKVFNKNKKIFQDVLGNDITQEKLLNRIFSDDYSLRESLNNHEGLLGILLGYGTQNAMLFHKKRHLQGLSNQLINFEFMKKHISKLTAKLSPTYLVYSDLYVVNPVGFIANLNHPETKTLIQKYEKVKSNVAQAFNSHNFIDVIISKLNER